MNRLLEHYQVEVEYPEVSGAEHLQMLQIRDRLAEGESTLAQAEREALATADRRLLEQAASFYAELRRLVDLARHRQEHEIPPTCWWWYLDVVAELPAGAVVSPVTQSAG